MEKEQNTAAMTPDTERYPTPVIAIVGRQYTEMIDHFQHLERLHYEERGRRRRAEWEREVAQAEAVEWQVRANDAIADRDKDKAENARLRSFLADVVALLKEARPASLGSQSERQKWRNRKESILKQLAADKPGKVDPPDEAGRPVSPTPTEPGCRHPHCVPACWECENTPADTKAMPGALQPGPDDGKAELYRAAWPDTADRDEGEEDEG